MTNQFYSKNATINIYIANLNEYNKGKLIGGWVSFPIDEEKLKRFINAIGEPQEFMVYGISTNIKLKGLKYGIITNIKLKGLKVEKYPSVTELNELCQRISCIDGNKVSAFNAIFEVLGYFEDALDCLESDDYVFYEGMTMEEVAQKFLEGAHAIPSYFKKHIDYKSIARDMLDNGYYNTDYGVIEIL